MTTRKSFSNDTEVPASTLTELFLEGVDRFSGKAAFQYFEAADRIVDIGYAEAFDRVRSASAALEELGIARGERVAIFSENRPEWAIADYACLCSGVIVVPIYPTLTAAKVGYVLEDSGAKVVLTSDHEQTRTALEAARGVSHDVTVVAFEAPPMDRAIAWGDVLERVAGHELEAGTFRTLARTARPEDVATILYTSGTTGEPKGVMLTHNNVASNVRASRMVLPIVDTDNTMSFLPLSHILQRMVDYLFFWSGCTIGYPRSLDTLIVDLKALEPTLVVSVPRIYEKIYNGVMDARGPKKMLIDWAIDVADRAADLRLAGRQPGGWLGLQYRIADALVFSKVRDAVGGRLRFFVSGGGPLAPALNRFFYSIGLTILEGYGLTETSPVTNVNTPQDFRIGTVGKPIPATEIRIAADGEILVRGPQVMKGYYRRPEQTAEVLQDDGWFATGDIGEIDQDGFLTITDRKKDIIVTAGGKNVAPQPIENRLTTHSLIEQAVVVGDRRKYPALLVVPAMGPLEAWARNWGISWSTVDELLSDARVVGHMESEVSGMLSDFASYELPKRVALIAEEFTTENGFLTPTLKVKRRVVSERLAHVIDRLYDEEPSDETAVS